jgi:hypothetical protein
MRIEPPPRLDARGRFADGSRVTPAQGALCPDEWSCSMDAARAFNCTAPQATFAVLRRRG